MTIHPRWPGTVPGASGALSSCWKHHCPPLSCLHRTPSPSSRRAAEGLVWEEGGGGGKQPGWGGRLGGTPVQGDFRSAEAWTSGPREGATEGATRDIISKVFRWDPPASHGDTSSLQGWGRGLSCRGVTCPHPSCCTPNSLAGIRVIARLTHVKRSTGARR